MSVEARMPFGAIKIAIAKTYLYNADPLKPHFYIVKLWFTGVYIIFLISAQKHRLWVPRKRGFVHTRTVKDQTNLRIRAVWTGCSLSAERITGYCKTYKWKAKVWMLLCACAGWSDQRILHMFEGILSLDLVQFLIHFILPNFGNMQPKRNFSLVPGVKFCLMSGLEQTEGTSTQTRVTSL